LIRRSVQQEEDVVLVREVMIDPDLDRVRVLPLVAELNEVEVVEHVAP
jgi:hypothetical protein